MAETYILKVLVDDTAVKDLEKRLGGIFGTSSGSNTGGGNSNEIVKNISKLGAIAAAIGGIFVLVKKISEMTVSASPMLQAMLKLLDSSITLILRPIGDFIGFLLRPILMTFLLYIALPFYRYMAPLMQKYGTKIGQLIDQFLSTGGTSTGPPSSTGKTPFQGTSVLDSIMIAFQNFLDNIQGDIWILGTIVKTLSNIPNSLQAAWSSIISFFNIIQSDINTILTPAWNLLSGVFRTIWNELNIVLTPAWNLLHGFFSSVSNGIKTLFSGWDILWSLFDGIYKGIVSTLQKGWQALLDFFSAINNFFKDPIGALSKLLGLSSGTSTPNAHSSSSAGGNIAQSAVAFGTNIENLTVHVVADLNKDAADFLKDPYGYISSIVQNSIRRTNIK